MKEYVQQHYVPQFYLRNFGIKRKRKYTIKCYSKIEGKEFVQNVNQVGMENYFYDKTAPPQIEEHLSQKEKEHSKVYYKIIKSESIKNLSDSEKFSMCEYIFIQNERTRSTRERYRQIVKEIYKKFEKEEGYPKFEDLPTEYQEWLLESRGEMAQLNIIFNIFVDENGKTQSSSEIIRYILDLEWNLTKNTLSTEFYTSDHPVVVFNPIYSGDDIVGFGSASYRAEGVEIFFPLSPKLCLILYDKNKSEYRKVRPERIVKEAELNWINTQIIAMAHRTVFTRTNDFQFVKMCLDKFPELKDLDRNRIFEYNLDL